MSILQLVSVIQECVPMYPLYVQYTECDAQGNVFVIFFKNQRKDVANSKCTGHILNCVHKHVLHDSLSFISIKEMVYKQRICSIVVTVK